MASLAGYNYTRYPRSTSGQPPTARSTLMSTLYIPGRDKRLVFASEWVFKPEGIKAVKTKFQDALRKNDLIANHEWDGKDNVFRVRCVVNDTPKVSALFSDILYDIVTESHGDDYLSDEDDGEIMVTNSEDEEEPFQSDKIERVSAWKKRYGITEPIIENKNTLTAIIMRRHEAALRLSQVGAVSDEPKYDWTPEDTGLELRDDIVPDDILKIIRDLTGCHITKDIKQGKLFIRHSSPEAYQSAIKKLRNLKKYSVPKIPYVTHIFYTEGVHKFRLGVCPFVDMKKGYLKSTLLHPYEIEPTLNYSKLCHAFTLRCAPWNGLDGVYAPTPPGRLVPVTTDLGAASKSRERVNFQYRGKGSFEKHPLRHIVDDEERQVPSFQERPKTLARGFSGDLQQVKQTRIEGWAQQLPQEPPTDSLDSTVGGSITAGPTIPGPNINHIEATNSHPTTQSTLTHSQAPNSIGQSLLDEDMPQMDFAPLQPVRARWSSNRLHAVASSSKSSVHPITIARNLNNTACSSPTESLQRAFHVSTKADIAPRQSTIKPSKEAHEAGYSGEKKLQSNKGKNLPPLSAPDPTPEFISDIKSSFSKLMTGIQGFPGEVVVQAEMGKIILRKLNRKFVSFDGKQSFSSEELLTHLLSNPDKEGNPAQVFFTNVLTTLSTDVSYLVDMNNQAGNTMWKKYDAESSITYEFSCHAESLSGRNPFTIEIDGETFSTRIKTKYDFGAINIHSTLRHWDFRVVAFGFGDGGQNEKLYGDFARAIQRSLYIPLKLSKPCLYFELDESFFAKSKLTIESILVNHTTKYKSTDENTNSILSISEVRALDVDRLFPFQGADFQVYKAEWPQAHRDGIDELNVWHEASISSAKANEELKQNMALKLGDEAEWSPESLLKLNAVGAMCVPACEMLKQMDGVGFHNNNGIVLREPAPKPPSPKPYFFW